MEWTQVQFIQVLSLCADLKPFTGVFPSSATLCFLFSTFIWHVYILVTLQIQSIPCLKSVNCDVNQIYDDDDGRDRMLYQSTF